VSRIAVLCVFLFANLVIATSDEFTAVGAEENALVRAIRTRDRALLLRLTDPDFHVSWSYGSAILMVRGELSREQWIANLSSPQVAGYAMEISGLRKAGQDAVYANLKELLTVRSADGASIQRRIDSIDMWRKQQNRWELVSRLSHSGTE